MPGSGFGIAGSFYRAILYAAGEPRKSRRMAFIISGDRGYNALVRHLFSAKSALVAVVLGVCAPALAAPPPEFDREIQPVFEQHCLKCHGPDKQKGGLRLDLKASVLKGGDSGEPAVVPGSPPKSHLLKLIAST